MANTNIKDLYDKVANDTTLLTKFNTILQEAQAVGREGTEEKLLAFAHESGFEISIQEMQIFFQELVQEKRELSDIELDMVAGGKSYQRQMIDLGTVIISMASLGVVCVVASIAEAVITNNTHCYLDDSERYN
jgi:predicted ribosomally synthesized peptide with nif11-like leader